MLIKIAGTKLASMGVAGMLTLGVLGGGVAYAQQGASDDATPVAIQQAAKEKPGILKHLLADVVKVSGLSNDVFKTGFKNGQSINDILTANGKTPATVEAAVATDVNARIDQALAAGKITSDQATKLKGSVPQRLDKLFAAQRPPKPAPAPKANGAVKLELTKVATILGMDPKTLAQDLKNGQTIAQVAGPKTQDVINALVADANAALDKALASGKLTQAQHDKAAANVTARVTKLVNTPHTGPKGK